MMKRLTFKINKYIYVHRDGKLFALELELPMSGWVLLFAQYLGQGFQLFRHGHRKNHILHHKPQTSQKWVCVCVFEQMYIFKYANIYIKNIGFTKQIPPVLATHLVISYSSLV